MDNNVNGEPVSFDSHRAKYFERQSKAQAATIIDLEAKIAYLEAKVEHLDGCLQRERARNHLGINPDAPSTDSPRASWDATSSRYDTVAFSSSSQELKLTLKRPASPEPALFTNLPASLKKKLANPEKKIKTEQNPALDGLSALSPSSTDGVENTSSSAHALQHQTRPVSSVTVDSSHSVSQLYSGASIQDRLAELAFFPVTHLVQNPFIPVTRHSLSKSQLCVPANGVYLRNEAGRNFMFLSPDYHAHVPTQPGGPGVLLSIYFPPDWPDGIQTVFTKLPGSPQNRRTKYVYLGEYCTNQCNPDCHTSHGCPPLRFLPMTASEYVGLPSETKKTLALRILYDDICKDVQKRIIPDFRRPHVSGALAHERSLTLTELKRAEASEAMETVLTAYRQGKERLDVWLLRCMSFDEMLLRDIAKLRT